MKIETYRSANAKSRVGVAKQPGSGAESSASVGVGGCSKQASGLRGLRDPEQTLQREPRSESAAVNTTDAHRSQNDATTSPFAGEDDGGKALQKLWPFSEKSVTKRK